ncbi:Hypothetical protein, putative [Bodo saltans]|uniref:Uncharacterized protein n=1 Tax=Bodo saltans TaxID=75058 RepID=A0A0S4IYG3_BODSA|nr:Hypothetical protein, putative [Bodo saltans]|eukprot:CUG50855.1 Hypothetical protein, putative [Bodo saltans]
MAFVPLADRTVVSLHVDNTTTPTAPLRIAWRSPRTGPPSPPAPLLLPARCHSLPTSTSPTAQRCCLKRSTAPQSWSLCRASTSAASPRAPPQAQ